MRGRQGRLFVVSSPSGGGKTTVVEELLRREPGLARSVSVTTRPRRRSERHGVDYRFVSPAAFAKLRAARQLLEQARVHGAWYGTPRQAVERVLARRHDVVLCIDVQGARQIRRRFGRRAVLIFVLPPSLAALRARLAKRRTETPAQVRRRMAAARRELACARWYDYAIVNRDVREAVERLRAILIAERARTNRYLIPEKEM